jgi:hypothetical protein
VTTIQISIKAMKENNTMHSTYDAVIISIETQTSMNGK